MAPGRCRSSASSGRAPGPCQRRNLGEAEAIFLARRRGGVLVSEDRDARVLAASELGPGRVASTPDLVARAVRMGLVEVADAWKLHRAMVAAGRRPGRLDPGLFGARFADPGGWLGGNADGASVGGAVWTSGPPLGGGRSRGSKG